MRPLSIHPPPPQAAAVAARPPRPSNSRVNSIETHALCKSYNTREVLHAVNLRVERGVCCGLLGPNGAGKTTLIRILLGLLRASSGHARIDNHDCWHDGARLRASIGYLPGDVRFYERLTGRRTLSFLAAVRRQPADDEIRRLATLFDLDLDKRVRNYSHGMKQKLGLVQALMHRPALLILDEPTTALDPLVRRTLFEELRRIAAEGRTVLFSSHTLSEVEALCDRVAILRDGRLVEQDAIAVLRRKALRRIELTLRPGERLPEPLPAELLIQHRNGQHVTATCVGLIEPLLVWLARCPAADVTIGAPDLEDLFMAYYSEPPAPAAGGAVTGAVV